MKTKISKSDCSLIRLAAKERTRYALNGVFVKVDQGKTEYVATNGRVLGVIRHTESESVDSGQCIIPIDAIKATDKNLNKTGTMEISAEDEHINHHVEFKGMDKSSNAVNFGSATVEGQFPEYEGVIPKDEPESVAYFGIQYLKDIITTLEKFRTDTKEALVKVELHGDKKPMVFTTYHDNSKAKLTTVIMPVEMNEGWKS